MIRRPPRSPLFPYPPLFRSLADVLAEPPPHVEPQQWHLPRLAHRLGYLRQVADSQGGEPGVADATAAARRGAGVRQVHRREIGRAAGRGRGEISVVGGSLKKKNRRSGGAGEKA